MRFVFMTALRETRSAWKRLVFFFVCIAIGVGAIVALRSVIQSVRQVLSSEARSLMAADIFISTDRPWQSGTPERIASRVDRIPNASRIDAIEMVTMARPADERVDITKVVELRAVQAGFPFYGRLTLQDGRPYSHSLLENNGALVRPELLSQFGLAMGDAIAIGKAQFVVRGLIALEPGRSLSAFSLGPRVLIDYDDLAETGLVALGSRVSRQMLLRVPESEIDVLARDLAGRLESRIRARAQLSRSAGADRRGLRAGRELPQSRRSRHRRAGRHRRVERHARVRAAEDQEHRRHEMRGWHEPADSQCVSSPVPRAWRHRQRDRRRPRVDCDCGHSRRHEPDRDALGGLRVIVVRGGAGDWRRGARVAAFRDGAVARSAAGETLASAAAGNGCTPARLVPDRGDGGCRRRARRTGVMAGGVDQRGPECVRRVHRPHARAPGGRLVVDAAYEAAGTFVVVSDAAGGAALQPPRQSNARHSADGRARHVFHHGRARLAGEPARSVRASDRREHAGHVSRRHPAGPGCRDESVSRRAAAAGISAAFHSRAARARHRQGRESRRGGRPPGARPLVARVHDHVPRTSGVERDAGQGNISQAHGGV